MARYEVKNPLTPEGRNQLNAMFEELYKEYIGAGNNAKDAREKAVQAVADSILAKDIAETTRQEMLAIIREQTKNGDLAPEIAQARGGKQTLGERFNSVDSQLAQIDQDLDYRGVYVWNFRHLIPLHNVVVQNEWDWYPAIQAAINHVQSMGGGVVWFPNFRMYTSKSPKGQSSSVILRGLGRKSEIWYTGDYYNSSNGDDGLAVIIWKPTASALGVRIENLLLNGDHKTLWGIYAERCFGLTVDVDIKRTAGFIRTDHCYNSNYNRLLLEYSTKSRPAEIPLEDWRQVSNFGLIYTTLGNGDKFGSIKIYGFGMTDEPARSLFNINAQVTDIDSLVVERDNVYLDGLEGAGKVSINHLFWPIGGNINIRSLYLEHMNNLCLLTSSAPGNHNIKIENVFYNLSNSHYYPFQILAGVEIKIGQIYVFGSNINTTRFVHFAEDVKANALENPILWYEGDNNFKIINGKQYADPQRQTMGVQSSNGIVMSADAKPQVESGFSVIDGEDEFGYFIAVEHGSFTNHLGEMKRIGIYTNGNYTGWVLRPNLTTNASYNICIDVYGGVYMERNITPTDKRTGKIIIATLNVGSSLDDKTLTPV